MKRILLKFSGADEAIYFKLKQDKIKREEDLGISLNWEDYFYVLFGLAKRK